MVYRIRIRNHFEVLCWAVIIASFSVVSTHVHFLLFVPHEDYARLNGHPLIVATILGSFLGYIACWQIMIGQNSHVAFKQSSGRDVLTGVMTRARFFERAEDVSLENASIVMLDVDHFKSVNDTYGHQFGDQVLAQVGRILGDTCRQNDLVARYGGEEFVILIPDSGKDAARELAERLRLQVRTASCEFNGHQLQVSISLGVALGGKDVSLDSMIARADAALLMAKSRGRDQVVSELTSVVPVSFRAERQVSRL